MNRRNRISVLIVMGVALILGCIAYIEDYYRAENVALECIENPKEGIKIYETDGKFVFKTEHTEEYEGLILLGSYSTENLRETDLKVLSIYGSKDKVLNAEKYEENRRNLPDDFKELVIEGGCHAYFGSYGAQEGDGQPMISNKEQVQLTVDAIESFVK